MAEPTLELLQTMIQKVLENQRHTDEKLKGIDARLLAQEQHMTAVHLDDHAIKQELRSIGDRLDRIDRRFELRDA